MLAAVERAKAAGATVSPAASACRAAASTWRRRSSRAPPPTPRSRARSCSARSRRSTASRDFDEALAVANASPYGLTAAIWTGSVHRGAGVRPKVVARRRPGERADLRLRAARAVRRPEDSGTGWREPGTEALDVYSDWKTVYVTHDPPAVVVPSAVALVPARAGSQRVPGKNVLPLAGHPLIAYSIAGAQEAASSTRSSSRPTPRRSPRSRGATAPRYRALRPAEMARPTSFDIEWVLHVMRTADEEIFAILRPTSPFRTRGDDPARVRAAGRARRPAPTRSARSSRAASTPGRCGRSTAT